MLRVSVALSEAWLGVGRHSVFHSFLFLSMIYGCVQLLVRVVFCLVSSVFVVFLDSCDKVCGNEVLGQCLLDFTLSRC